MPATEPEPIRGIIERVTYFSEESGFAVLRVQSKGRRGLVTVVGQTPIANPGEWIEATGSWVQDRDYGLQFRAEHLSCTPPTTKRGIEKYLASGMVKGIGPVYAKKLVDRFGQQIFDVIEHQSAQLEKIEGIGPHRRRQIRTAWEDQKVVRSIMLFLHSHEVSTSRALRIYKTYGQGAVATVRSNPYLLARDIRGIGFPTADQIARKLGVPFNSVARARAGLSHVLLEATRRGHCALPEPALKEAAGELLEVEVPLLDQAFEESLAAHEVVRETLGNACLVFLPYLKRAEEVIAERIGEFVSRPASYPPIAIDKAVSWCEKRIGITLASSQRQALEIALTRRVVVITGGPGVGKTTLLNSLVMILRAKRVTVSLCAPTGRAAKRLTESTGIEAKTIHRLLEVSPKTGGFSRNEANPLKTDLLVVDECSMVDVPLMHSLLRALPRHSHLVLVGDVDQLPSVGPGRVLAEIIASAVASVVRLTEIFRQGSRSHIVANAHRINQGFLPETPRLAASDFFFIEREDAGQAAATLIQVVRERIPRKFKFDPIRDVQVLCPMNRGKLGVRELNLTLQQVLNPLGKDEPMIERFGWQFRVRDKVIQTENNYDKEVFNGDLGQIEAVNLEEREVTIQFDQRKVTYEHNELEELSLAYAISIHKAQGSEFPAVVIPLAMEQYVLLQRNLLYTGVTRGRRLVVLIGQKKALATAVRNARDDTRYSGLLFRLKQRAKGSYD